MRNWFLLPILMLVMAWTQELIDQIVFNGTWNLPMGSGLPWWRVITAPFSHSGFGHLISNSIIFLTLSWLVLTRGIRDYIFIWVAVVFVSMPIALLWPTRSHGLSGVVYGLLGYLLLVGWLEKRVGSIFLSALTFWLYGPTLIALIPGLSPANISWVSHAAGFGAGLLSALTRQERANSADSHKKY
ncbi:rhomboid family intramembrane serine protease [Synechococcus sp. M16CYN]|uniref:rhomboid family intramembrane serine protease n=1 Tax=Synechococcus sp. M16CYN TaxID=3103139 RepID=UPI0030E2F722